MSDFQPKYSRGVWLSLDISHAAIELDLAVQEKVRDFNFTDRVRKILKGNYEREKKNLSIGFYEYALSSALGLGAIPEMFNITRENCRSYTQEDYLAGMELVLEQFEDLDSADKKRLAFLRDFMVSLSNHRISKLESLERYMVA